MDRFLNIPFSKSKQVLFLCFSLFLFNFTFAETSFYTSTESIEELEQSSLIEVYSHGIEQTKVNFSPFILTDSVVAPLIQFSDFIVNFLFDIQVEHFFTLVVRGRSPPVLHI